MGDAYDELDMMLEEPYKAKPGRYDRVSSISYRKNLSFRDDLRSKSIYERIIGTVLFIFFFTEKFGSPIFWSVTCFLAKVPHRFINGYEKTKSTRFSSALIGYYLQIWEPVSRIFIEWFLQEARTASANYLIQVHKVLIWYLLDSHRSSRQLLQTWTSLIFFAFLKFRAVLVFEG